MEDQEAQSISSPLTVSEVDEHALELRAADMQHECIEVESQNHETENGSLAQDDALAVYLAEHHDHEAPLTQAQLEQEGLNGGDNVTEDVSMGLTKEEGGIRQEVGETKAQVEQESSNEDECSADVAFMDTTEDVQTFRDNNGPVDQTEREPELEDNECHCAASGASMIRIQQEEEPVEGETPPQMEQQVVTADNDNCVEKEEDCKSLKQNKEIPVVGSDEGEKTVMESSVDTVQTGVNFAEGKAHIQAGEGLEVELNDNECAPELMDNALIQNGQKPEARATETESDHTFMVTAHEEERSGDEGCVLESEYLAALHEGGEAMENDASLGETEESADPVETEAAHNMEASAVAYEMVDVETPSEAEQSQSDSSNQDGPSCLAIDSEEHLPEENHGLAVLKDEPRNPDSNVYEAVESKVDANQVIKADSTEPPALNEFNENADHQAPPATRVNEPPAVPIFCEYKLIKEPSLCTPAIDPLLDPHSEGPETHEKKAGTDEQAGSTNAPEGGHEMQKEVSRELLDFPMQDLEIEQPTAQEGLSDAKVGLAAEEEPIEDSLATSMLADMKQLEAVPPSKNGQLGVDNFVIEQASKGEEHAAVMPMLVDNGDVDNSAEGQGAMNKLERVHDVHLNGKVESSLKFKAANAYPVTAVESGDCHNVDEAMQVYICGRANDNGVEANGSKTNSAQNGLLKGDTTADSCKLMALEQWLDEEKNAMAGIAQRAEVPMEVAVPLSSMVQENGFLYRSSKSLQNSFKGLKQKDAKSANGNTALVRRTTWWECCGMLDALLHRG